MKKQKGPKRSQEIAQIADEVEQGECKKGLCCDDVTLGHEPLDNKPKLTANLARVVINSLRDSASVCGHMSHPAYLTSTEHAAG